jgi:hypothetical protein
MNTNPLNQPINSYFLVVIVDGKEIAYYPMSELKTIKRLAATAPGTIIKRRAAR